MVRWQMLASGSQHGASTSPLLGRKITNKRPSNAATADTVVIRLTCMRQISCGACAHKGDELMSNKLILGVLGASLILGAAPAFAQNDRSRDNARNTERAYSQEESRQQQNARNQRPRQSDARRNSDVRRNNVRGFSTRKVFQTRYRARVVLTEEIVRNQRSRNHRSRNRRGPRLVCTVEARGPQARYVPKRRLRRIARNNCSRRARVRIIR